ncbi:hypothetical protein V6R21_23575 [Limibacter armeniacum]|uniref:hypothetical protein n=1 Tax=Limibacter armeniacum TaxID=466084 RepID=UPI002FE655F2
MATQLDLQEVFKPENYPLFASSKIELDTFANMVEIWIDEMDARSDLKDVEDRKNGVRRSDLLEKKADLGEQEQALIDKIANESDPAKKSELEHTLKGVSFKIGEIDRQLSKNLGGMYLIKDFVNIKTSEAIIQEVKQGMVTYLNDYFVPGNLGSGTVTFDGVDYTAS